MQSHGGVHPPLPDVVGGVAGHRSELARAAAEQLCHGCPRGQQGRCLLLLRRDLHILLERGDQLVDRQFALRLRQVVGSFLEQIVEKYGIVGGLEPTLLENPLHGEGRGRRRQREGEQADCDEKGNESNHRGISG